MSGASKENKKKPLLIIKDRNALLYALDIQKLLGLTIFPQHFVKWPEKRKDCKACAYYYLEKSVLTPAPRRTWVDDEKTINKTRLIKAVQTITKELLPTDGSSSTVTTEQRIRTTSRKRKADTLFPLPLPGTPDAYDRTLLLLNVEQMKSEKVPLPLELLDQRKYFKNRSDYVPSKSVYLPVSANSPMFAVDCEMVLTSVGSELARVTMVDEKGTVIFDRLVKPPNPIKDYLTKFSGITRDMLSSIDTTLEDIQRELDETLPGDAILVGHSIGNDLDALKVFHPYLIDTSVIYNMKGTRASKARLRFLSEHFLGRMIQTGRGGHSSAEDAIATMDLVRLKLSQDIGFGDVTTSWRFPEDYQMPIDSKVFLFSLLLSHITNYRLVITTHKYTAVLVALPTTVPTLPITANSNSCTFHTNTNNDISVDHQALINNNLLTENQCFGIHPAFQDWVLKLCSFYKSLGAPIHLFNRLLHDSGITYAYWPIYRDLKSEHQQHNEEEEGERQQHKNQDERKELLQHMTVSKAHNNNSFIHINFDSTDEMTNGDNITTTINNNDNYESSIVVNKISKKLANYIVDLCKSHRLVVMQANCSPEWKEAKCYRKVAKFCTHLYSNVTTTSLIGVICAGSDFKKTLDKKSTHSEAMKSAIRHFYLTLNSNVISVTDVVNDESTYS
ncbi:RNA exonuclease 5 [Schistosoma japonicum]|nr:RNA exonuclease 5 [Schistosoma japonicum]